MRLQTGSLILAGIVASALVFPLTARADAPATHHAATAPTVDSALAAEQELARAMRENDAAGIARMLSDDWAVITARGGVGEGKDIFPEGIRTGELTRTVYEISEPRVRVDGNTAVVTTKLHLAGVFGGKPFDVLERVTDVFIWKDGGWKAVLTHETFIPPRSAS
jgi:ketosteroid isomerase-like protein